MGAGQIGGIASLLDIDFHNAAGFVGKTADVTEAQFIVYFLSHSMMFCTGALIEPHVVLTPASCVFGERYRFDVFGGAHKFLESLGSARTVQHVCTHRAYNLTNRACTAENLALLVLDQPYFTHQREADTEYVITRLRYAGGLLDNNKSHCKFYGWGSRRNGYLIPLLISLRRVETTIVAKENCLKMFDYDDKFLCLDHFPCRSDKYGALCPDDVGSVLVCNGYLRGMMISRLIDRPCGTGFLDLNKHAKFLTCGVDDSRDVIGYDDFMEFRYTTFKPPKTPSVMVVDENHTSSSSTSKKNKGTNHDHDHDATTPSVIINVSGAVEPVVTESSVTNKNDDGKGGDGGSNKDGGSGKDGDGNKGAGGQDGKKDGRKGDSDEYGDDGIGRGGHRGGGKDSRGKHGGGKDRHRKGTGEKGSHGKGGSGRTGGGEKDAGINAYEIGEEIDWDEHGLKKVY